MAKSVSNKARYLAFPRLVKRQPSVRMNRAGRLSFIRFMRYARISPISARLNSFYFQIKQNSPAPSVNVRHLYIGTRNIGVRQIVPNNPGLFLLINLFATNRWT